MGATSAILGGSAALGGLSSGMSILGARSANQQARSQAEAQAQADYLYATSVQRALGVQQRQIVDASALERQKLLRGAQDLVGRLRVAAGEAGLAGDSGSVAALDRQAAIDLAADQSILTRNASNQIAAARSQAAAAIASRGPASYSQQSPLLAGIGGGLSGFSTGLSIGTGVRSVMNPRV